MNKKEVKKVRIHYYEDADVVAHMATKGFHTKSQWIRQCTKQKMKKELSTVKD